MTFIHQATESWDPGQFTCRRVQVTVYVFLVVTGLGTPNFGKLKDLVTF